MTFTHTHAWTLDTNPGRVFRAITDRTELTAWFAEDIAIEPHIGGAYRFWGRNTLGTPPQDAARQTVTRYEPDAALAFTWPIHDVETDVTMVLVPHGKGTRFTVTHQWGGLQGRQSASGSCRR